MAEEVLLSNCPRDCYDGCGVQIEKRGDRLIVRGNPAHPVSRGSLCRKCTRAYNDSWQDPSQRLTRPLRRSGPKGSGRYEPVPWDDALADIAARLKDTLARYGGGAIMNAHYSGTLALTGFAFPMRFFHAIGADEADPDSICNAAGHAAWGYLFGESYSGFDPRTIRDTRCLLLWGANPAHAGPHVFEHWFAASPALKIVVDPLRSATAAAADIHLQPRPGSDAALAFALAHALRREGLFDEACISGHVLGADELEAQLDNCTPAWGERMTGVPAAAIEAAARAYGRGPSLLWAGQALSRQPAGGNAMRAVGMLAPLTGNLGKPGAGMYYLNFTPALAGLDLDWLTGSALLPRERTAVPWGRMADVMLGERYRMFFCWNTNPLVSAPQQRKLRTALAREDLFSVVIDCFHTDTAGLADYILPAASFLEEDDITFSYFNLLIGAQRKAREPLGEALPNAEIFRRLAAATGLHAPALHESQASLLATMCAQMGIEGGFEGLAAKGWTWMTEAPVTFWEDGRFPTPSGRVEIASASAAADGHPRLPQPLADPPPAAGCLRLLSPASDWRLNGSYANDPGLARRAGPATVHLAPTDAAARGLASGDLASLDNASGSLRLTVEVDTDVLPGTALVYKGRWPQCETAGGNINTLHDGSLADMGAGNPVHGIEVRVTAAMESHQTDR